MSSMFYDAIIIGGGIIGLATARHLLKRWPHLKVAILEKEDRIAKHQTGHNSGVIHSGIYYKPGSLKAQNCIQGVKELKAYCDERNIPYQSCGKVIVATHLKELPRLDELVRRGNANGVEGLERIGAERLKEIEPAVYGIQALYSPKTAIINFVKVAEEYANDIKILGGTIFLSQKVEKIFQPNTTTQSYIATQDREYSCKWLINCAGVYADRIAHLADPHISPKQIIPFRGEYYELKPEKRNLINGLVYPIPDPKFPFLGVHLSRTIDGLVEAGPNAVLALSREGYNKLDIKWKDCLDYVTYQGFWRMAARYWKVGIYELYRSYSKSAFLKALQRLVPELRSEDLITCESGVRSQVVLPNGRMEDDFAIIQRPGQTHVLNAPSPGATASLSIARSIVENYLSI